MSQNKTAQNIARFVGFLGVGVLIAFVFNNCGANPFYAQQANIPVHKLQDDMVRAMGGKLPASACNEAAKYHCSQQIFSPAAEYGQSEITLPCVRLNNGSEMCLQGHLQTYNTAAAVELCKEDCDDNYDYEEFNCYFEQMDENGFYPLRASASKLEDALNETHSLCMRVVNGE